MKKVWQGCLFFLFFVLDSFGSQSVDPSVINRLANMQVPVSGYFAQYDPNDPYGWIYLTSDQRTLVKLEGIDPETGYFRWTPMNEYFDHFGFDGEHIIIGNPRGDLPGTAPKHIQGTVVGSNMGHPIPEARIFLIDSESNRIIASTVSNSEGKFDLVASGLNPEHSYIIMVSKDGYQQVMGTLNSDLLGNVEESSVNYGVIQLIDNSNTIHAMLTGSIIDSTTGMAIPDALVKVYPGEYVTSSSSPLVSARTDSQGHFDLADIPAGHYTLVVQKDGYLTNYTNLLIDEDREYIEISLSPQLVAGQNFRIQLSWGATPEDLDSHFVFLKNGALQYHIYWSQQYAYYDQVHNQYVTYDSRYHDDTLRPVAFLDRDDTTSYGPETVTIYELDTIGVYKYFVHDYTDRHNTSSEALAHSGARVKIFNEEGVQRIFNVPDEPGVVWKVFEIQNGRIVPCQSGCMIRIHPTDEELATRAVRDIVANLLSSLPKK